MHTVIILNKLHIDGRRLDLLSDIFTKISNAIKADFCVDTFHENKFILS